MYSLAGYSVSDSGYERDLVVGSTVMTPRVTDHAFVQAYQHYDAPDVELDGLDLSRDSLSRMDDDGIMIRIQMAMDGIRQQIEKVLGKSGEEGATVDGEDEMVVDDTDKDKEVSRGFWAGVWDSITQSSPDHNAKSLKEANNGRLRQYAAGGTFGIYLGFEPIFKKSPDVDNGLSSNLLREGSGEYGRLVTSYTWNMYREMKGYAEADTAVWDKRVWDDSGSWFKAPTIKGIVDMGVTIAATVMTGGAGGGVLAAISSAGIGLIDDAAFAVLDVGGGHKKWEQAGLDFGKKALSAAVNVGAGQAFGSVMGSGATKLADGTVKSATGLMAKQGMSGVLARTAWTGLQTATTSTATSAINAFNWSAEGGFGWSSDAFASGMGGGISGSLSSMASSLTSGSLGQWNMYDGNNLALTDSVFNTASIGKFNGMMGGLASSTASWAMTGDYSLNVLNAADLSGGALQGGLLEMHFGDNGFSMNAGMGGADMSLGTLAASMSGFKDTLKLTSAKLGSALGDKKGISDLNAVNMLGYTGDAFNIALAKGIWSGDVQTRYEGLSKEYGYYDQRSPTEITLAESLLGTGKDKAAMLASVMAHEGTHLAGNRVEGIAHMQAYGTYTTLVKMLGLNKDETIIDEMEYAITQQSSWELNTGSVDNWIVRLDGSIYDNGTTDVEYEDGRETIKGDGKQSVLQEWLGGDDSTFNAFTSLMKGAGYNGKDISTWSGMKGTSISRSQIDQAYEKGLITKEQYSEIVGAKRTDYDYARQEQNIQRAFTTKKKLEVRLASLVESNLPVPGAIIMGSGKPGDPKAYTGQGSLSQLELARALGYLEVGPCYLTSNCMPYLLMGVSQDKIIKAIDKIDTKGLLDAKTAEFLQDSTVFWGAMQEEMKLPGIPSWYGSARQDMDWTAFVASGATMGLLWMDNPNRVDSESQHWGFVYNAGDSWYYQDPYNKSSGGIFSTWGVTTWKEIIDYKIRPIQITTP